MSYAQFMDLTPLEFYHALQDRDDAIEAGRRFELEKMRLQTFYLYNMSRTKKADQARNVKKFMTFAWERAAVEPPRILTEEEWKELDEKVKRLTAKAKPIR